MSQKGISQSLRVGRVKPDFRNKLVKLTYGRSGGERDLFSGETFGGCETLPRILAAHFAEDYVKLLTEQDLAPDFLLGEAFGFAGWERRIGSWTYFISLEWEEPKSPLSLPEIPRMKEPYFHAIGA
jgi:hypothetical protein